MTMSSWLTSPLLRTGMSSSPMSSSILYTAEGMNTVDSVCREKKNKHQQLISSLWYSLLILFDLTTSFLCYLTHSTRKLFMDDRPSGKLNVIHCDKPSVYGLIACTVGQMKAVITALLTELPSCFIKTHHLLFIYLQQIFQHRLGLQRVTQRDGTGYWPGKLYRWMWKISSAI